jgi:hypothetical protein
MAQPDKPIQVTITRTDYAPGIDNEWQVETEAPRRHLTHHPTIEEALLTVRAIMEIIEEEQVHR